MKKSIPEGSELDGYDALRPEDQAKIVQAWQEGHVADEDIPETARKPAGEDGKDGDEEEKPKKAKRAPAKKKAAAVSDGEAEERPKRKAKTVAAKVRSLLFKWLHTFLYILIMVYIYRRLMMRTRMTKRRRRRKSPRRRRGLHPRRKLNPKKRRHPRNVHQRRKKKLVFFGLRRFCNIFLIFFLLLSRSLTRSLGKISLKSSMMCLSAQMKRMNLRKRRNLRRRLLPRNQLLRKKPKLNPKPKLNLKRNPRLNRRQVALFLILY